MDEEDYEMTDEDNEAADNIARSVKKREATRSDLEMGWGEEASKATDPKLDPGQKGLASNFEKFADAKEKNAASGLKKNKPKGAAMAMKGDGGELPPLDPYDEDALGNVGMKVMADLSKANQLTDSAWLEAMKKRLRDPDIERPDLEPYLPHIRAISEEIRDTALNNIVGTGDPMKDARKIFTRKRPPIEESIEAIHRAMVADPSGNKVSPAEAYHIWNYLKQRFLDKDSPSHTLDFKEIRAKASQELGIKDDTGNIIPGKERITSGSNETARQKDCGRDLESAQHRQRIGQVIPVSVVEGECNAKTLRLLARRDRVYELRQRDDIEVAPQVL